MLVPVRIGSLLYPTRARRLTSATAPGNGAKMKIWQCYDNLPAQQWFYTGDNRVALTNRGLCLDLTNGMSRLPSRTDMKPGSKQNANVMQTWQCTPGNTNQIWTSNPTVQRRSLRYSQNK